MKKQGGILCQRPKKIFEADEIAETTARLPKGFVGLEDQFEKV